MVYYKLVVFNDKTHNTESFRPLIMAVFFIGGIL